MEDGQSRWIDKGWRDRIVLSRDPIYQKDLVYEAGSDDRILANHDWLTPAADAGFVASDHFQVPRVAPGEYYLIISLDENEILEDMNLANNQLAMAIQVLAPDLVPSDLSTPEIWETQQTVTVEWSVENRGDGESGNWRDKAYLAAEPTLDSAVEYLGYLDSNSLAVGASLVKNLTFEVPAIPQGHYYVMIECNAGEWVHEHSSRDQVLDFPVTVIGPDLVATAFIAPSAVVPGTRIDYEWSVINQGAAAGGLSEDAVYFSTDPVRSSDDEQLSWEIAPALESLASYDFWDTRVALPVGGPGRYYLLLAVDYARGVYEFDEANNLVVHPIESSIRPNPGRWPQSNACPDPEGSRYRLDCIQCPGSILPDRGFA